MPVHRIIFRLDFSPNFDIVEKPGTVMRMMDSAHGKLLPEIQETRTNRRIQGQAKSARESLVLVVEPTSIHFSLETLTGLALEQLENNDKLLRSIKLVQHFCEEFRVTNILRAGFRIFSFESLSTSKAQRNRQLLSFIEGRLVDSVSDQLGNISDCAILFDGKSSDGIAYHLRFGPFSRDEAQKYLSEFPQDFGVDSKYDSILDLDLYESNFVTPTVTFKKYLHPFLEKAATLITSINTITSP